MNKTYLKDDLVSFKDFINKKESQTLIDYFNHAGEYWSPICFYNSDGMAIVPNQKVLEGYDKIDISFLSSIQDKLKNALEEGLNTKVKANSIHAQRWVPGGYAPYHSDNSDMEGNPTAWRDNKYVAILYLNTEYEGGLLEFRDHDISIKPDAGELLVFPGGIENVHQVTEITDGLRYTIVAFWDYETQEYSIEEMDAREEEIVRERIRQRYEKQFWSDGIDQISKQDNDEILRKADEESLPLIEELRKKKEGMTLEERKANWESLRNA
jgi:hypothetical protein